MAARRGQQSTTPRPARQRVSEHDHQAELIRLCRMREALHPELALLHAIPNGGLRDPVTAGKLSAEGLRAGVPDLCLPVPRQGYHGLYVELKTQGGQLSPEQRWWAEQLRAQGYRVEACWGWEAAAVAIWTYLGIDLASAGLESSAGESAR